MKEIISSPAFSILISLGVFVLATLLNKKTKIVFLNPLLITTIIIIGFLLIFDIDPKIYEKNTIDINAFLGPLTVCLALPIFNRLYIVKKYMVPIIVGSIVGSIVSMSSVYLLGNAFDIDKEIIISLLPKSVTTPIAIEISHNLGGIKAITIASVVITGIMGVIVGPICLKIFDMKKSAVVGMAFGTSSHAVGTSKAVEISARAGAISSVAIVSSGIVTVFFSMFL